MKRLIRKIHDWLFDKFLPWETKEEYIKTLNLLREKNDALEQENKKLQAYIDGVQYTMRHQRRVEIKNEVSK